MTETIRWIVMVCVAGAALGDATGPDRPDITMLYRGSTQFCVAGGNTNGYGLAFMNEKLDTKDERIACEFKTADISCPSYEHRIHVTNAVYGRNSRDHCPSPGYDQNTWCSSYNAFYKVRSRCDGLAVDCEIDASNHIFGDPCSGVLKYLHVKYTCLLIPRFVYKDGSGATIDSSSDCDFEKLTGCWRSWHHAGISLQSSGLYPISPVTDERWNNFEIYRTVGKGDVIYNENYRIAEDFFIGISVRSTRNAHILLCSTQFPKSSACYWIVIDGNSNFDITGIRRCVQGVPDKFAQELDCKIFRDNITIPEKLLDESKWTHFMLSREGSNRIRLWLWDLNTGARPLLDYTDDHPLHLSYMFVRSYDEIADWKVHKYQYINILNNKKIIRLGPPLQFENTSPMCISLYATICAQCTLEIILETEAGVVEMQSFIEGDSTEPFMRWKNIRLQGGISKSKSIYYQLYVKLNTKNGTHDNNTFWAIDDFRKCHINEFRVAEVHSYNKLLCQSLKHTGWIFNPRNEVENYNEPPICSNGKYIGQHCNISFLSVIRREDRYKICMSTQKEKDKGACTCLPGFTWESGCQQECSSGWYGYNCRNKCGKCNNPVCDKRTGTCSGGCNNGYLPPNCQNIIPRLTSPPSVVKEFYTSVTVRFANIQINGLEDMVHAIYLERQKMYGQWVNCSEPLKLSAEQEVTITGLEKETTYRIRAIVYTDTGYAYRHEDVPTVEAITTCKVDREMYISEHSRNATISFETTSDSCLLKRYTIELQQNGKQIKPPQIVWENMILLDLMPHTDYQIILSNTRYPTYKEKKNFTTKQNAPGEINNLNILETTDKAVVLSWKEPEEKNGIIQKYNVTYELIQRIECNNKSSSQNGSLIVLPSKISKVTLSGLQPYSTYLITMTAETILPGKPTKLQCNTTLINDISEEELPHSISISDPSARSVTIKWQVNCVKQRGPLYFQIMLKCVQDEWCDQISDIILDNITSSNARATTHELTPFTHYLVELRAKRSQTGDLTTFNKTIEFCSSAGSPPAIRKFTHYSKDKSSLSLRWLDPNPPHGFLENYTIKYCYGYSCNSVEITTTQLEPCNLWKEHFKCYTQTGLNSENWYTVTITAKNKDTIQWGPETSLKVFTAEEKPSCPLNLTQHWENNEINLSWNHPNITNGRLMKFIVILKQTESELKNQDETLFYIYEHTISEEIKTYTYQIKKMYQYSSSYMLTVCGVNSYYGENATVHIDTQPKIPELNGDVLVDDQYTTDSTVIVILPGITKESKSLVSFLYVVVSKINSIPTINITQENGLNAEILKYSTYKPAWIAKEIIGISESRFKVFIGSEESTHSQQLNKKIINYKLELSTGYEVTFVLINRYKDEYSINVYYQNIWTASNFRTELYALLLLLLLPVVIYFLYRFIRQKKVDTAHNSTEPEASVKNIYFEMAENKSVKRNSDTLVDEAEEHIYDSISNSSLMNPVRQETANDNSQVYNNI